jgi:hypothetical protein
MRYRQLPYRPKGPYKNDRDHAILVGVQDYAEGIVSLRGSVNDCDLFSYWLAMPAGGGLDPKNIKCLCSTKPSDEEPMRDQVENLIIDYFDRQFETGETAGRRLYLFFSGHGVAPPVPNDEDCALVMANARLSKLRSLIGGLAARIVRKTALFEEVVLIMDCCREVTGKVSAACDLDSFEPDPTKIPGQFFHVFAASWASTTAEQQLPNPIFPKRPASWHGVLTHALIRGLLTAPNAGGDVTAATLEDFIRRAVESMSGGQTNWPKTEWDNSRPPLNFGKSDGVRVTVTLTDPAARLVVRDGADMAEIEPKKRAAGGSIQLWLRPGLYMFEAVDANDGVIAETDCKILEKELNVTL